MIILLLSQSYISHSQNLVISPGAGIRIGTDAKVEVDGNVLIKSTSEGTGILLDDNEVSALETIGDNTMECLLNKNNWYNVSAPMSGITSQFFGENLQRYRYDESVVDFTWLSGWVWVEENEPLNQLQGYDVYIVDDEAYKFEGGIFYTGESTTTVTKLGDPSIKVGEEGWNLLGNPYPCVVDWTKETGWNKLNVENSVSVWNEQQGGYGTYTGGKFPDSINGASRFIAPMQGFWVKAINPSGTFQINNNAKVFRVDNSSTRLKNLESDNLPGYFSLRFFIENDFFRDETLIRFIEGTSETYEPEYDATKLLNINSEGTMFNICSVLDSDKEIAINTMQFDQDHVIPLYFIASKEGDYSLKLKTNGEFPGNEDNGIWLVDLESKETIDLYTLPEYTFHYNSQGVYRRFLVTFNKNGDIQLPEELQFKVKALANKQIHIVPDPEVTVYRMELYDVSGNILRVEPQLYGETDIVVQSSRGIYFVKLIVDQRFVTRKVILF